LIIAFRFSNYRSIRTEQELIFTASKLKGPSQGVINAQSELELDLLRCVAIYGANASGKSNILRALNFLCSAVEFSQRRWPPTGPIPRDPFALDVDSKNSGSGFEVEILLSGVRYRYGFRLGTHEVEKEWLYAYPKGKKQLWFLRGSEKSTDFRFGKGLGGPNRTIQSLTRPNSLFLSAAAQNNHDQLQPLFDWFANRVVFVFGSNRTFFEVTTARMCDDPSQRDQLLAMLSRADLGLVGIDVKEEDFDENFRLALETFAKSVGLEGDSPPIMKIPRVRLKHAALDQIEPASLALEEESQGTRALFSLLGPAIQALQRGGMLCVDELDASLHPVLSVELVRVFNDSASNPKNAQLLFNTHDTHILAAEFLRRDQVWFTEKDRAGETHLYPLSDFRPRRTESLPRGYLQGRFGAIPFVKDLGLGMIPGGLDGR
jgi:hypothetical protein